MSYRLLVLFVSLSVCVNSAWCSGIATTFNEVLVENLEPGQRYSMVDIANYPYKVINSGMDATKLKIEPVLPDDAHLRPGFEKIPDISWIKFEKEIIYLDPGKTKTSDIYITIPEDEKILGKKYQVNLWAHTLPKEGAIAFTLGVESILLFTIVKETAGNETVTDKKKKASVNLSFTVEPNKIILKRIKAGKAYNIEEFTGDVLAVRNDMMESCKYRIESLSVSESLTKMDDGYEDCPDPSFLSFSEPEFIVPARSTRKIKLFVEFPKNKAYRKKKYMFIIHTSVAGKNASGGVYTRLYVETK